MNTFPTNYKPYPSDVSDEKWSFFAPFLTLSRLDDENRKHELRAVFNALRWLEAGCFEAMVYDPRVLLREYSGRKGQLSAVILDSRTLQSPPESGARAGYDGAKRRKGAKSMRRSIRWGTCWRCT